MEVNFNSPLTYDVQVGGLKVTSKTSTKGAAFANLSRNYGKYYFEVLIGALSNAYFQFGLAEVGALKNTTSYDSAGYRSVTVGTSYTYRNNSTVTSSTFSAGQVIGFAVDYMNEYVYVYKNNALISSINMNGSLKTYCFVPAVLTQSTSTANLNVTFRFNQKDFTYEPPVGYLPYEDSDPVKSIYVKSERDKENVYGSRFGTLYKIPEANMNEAKLGAQEMNFTELLTKQGVKFSAESENFFEAKIDKKKIVVE